MIQLARIWNKRADAFWKEAAIYWSYAFRGGLSTFLLLFLIIGSYMYMKALQTLSPDFPYWRVTTPVLAVALAWSPIRTFLKPADQVFLMPAATKLRGYWLRCFGYSYAFQVLNTMAALVVLWPLYKRCEGADALPFSAAAGVLLLVKLLALVSMYFESRLLFAFHRTLIRALRWTGSVVIAFTLLTGGLSTFGMALLIFAAASAIPIRLLPKHRIPWEYLIRKEAGHLKVHYTFFSWFTDVPKLQTKPKPRRWLAALVNRLPFDKSETYRYLVLKTLLRSELFSILARIMGIAVFLILLVENAVVEPFIYAFATLMSAATISSMDQFHRYSFWLELYPIPKIYRVRAILSTAIWTLLPFHAILGAALLFFHSNRMNSLAAVAAGLIFTLYYVNIPLRKRVTNSQDD